MNKEITDLDILLELSRRMELPDNMQKKTQSFLERLHWREICKSITPPDSKNQKGLV